MKTNHYSSLGIFQRIYDTAYLLIIWGRLWVGKLICFLQKKARSSEQLYISLFFVFQSW